jgi:hypothetical protein
MLKCIIKKENSLVQLFFRDSLNSGAYIISKELNQNPDFFVS